MLTGKEVALKRGQDRYSSERFNKEFDSQAVADLAREIQEIAQDIKQRPTEVGQSEVDDIEKICKSLRRALK